MGRIRPLSQTKYINDANLVAYWKLEDTSATVGGFTLTNVNSTPFNAGLFDNGANPNGSSQYLYNSSTSLDITGAFTVCAWVNFSSVSGRRGIMQERLTSDAVGSIYQIYLDAGTLRASTWASVGGFLTLDSGVSASTGTWYHVAFVKVSDSDWRLFINGVKKATSSSTRSLSLTGAAGCSIGADDYGASGVLNYLSGTIDDNAIFNRAISDGEIAELYQSMTLGEYLGAGSSITKGLYHLNGSSADSSGNGNNGVDTNIVYGLQYGKFGQGAHLYTGSTYSKIALGDAPFNFTGDFTIGMWYRPNAGFNDGGYVLSRTTGASPFVSYNIYPSTGNNGFVFQMNNTVATTHNAINASGVVAGNWYRVIATVIGTTMTLYVNGQPSSTTTFTGSRISNSIQTTIGARGTDNIAPASGDVDEVVLESGGWSAQKVLRDYTYGKGRFGII